MQGRVKVDKSCIKTRKTVSLISLVKTSLCFFFVCFSFRAVRRYTAAIRVDPTYIRAYICRAEAYHKLHMVGITRLTVATERLGTPRWSSGSAHENCTVFNPLPPLPPNVILFLEHSLYPAVHCQRLGSSVTQVALATMWRAKLSHRARYIWQYCKLCPGLKSSQTRNSLLPETFSVVYLRALNIYCNRKLCFREAVY